MSPPDEEPPFASFVHEEMMAGLSRNFGRLLERLPPVTRLRILAFVHLVEQPETMRATLDVDPSGRLRLTLDTAIVPGPSHQH